jgi:LacI family transcriptional regulator
LKLPHVGNDEEAIGRRAAEHLLDRRFNQLAFAGIEGALWSARRLSGFAAGAREFNAAVSTYANPPDDEAPLAVWEANQRRLAIWLRELPKPVGIMGASDRFALRILDACRREGIVVPEQAAVIGVDNDEETCRLADPPLSSVIDNAREVGLRAAALLDDWMHTGRRPKNDRVLVPPLGVATRRSTEATAVEDPLIARACQLIHARACEGMNVAALARALGVSRSLLHARYKKALNRQPNQDLLRARLDRARALLRQSSLSVSEIALRSGFTHPEYLTVVFQRELGITPARFRRAGSEGEPRWRAPSRTIVAGIGGRD